MDAIFPNGLDSISVSINRWVPVALCLQVVGLIPGEGMPKLQVQSPVAVHTGGNCLMFLSLLYLKSINISSSDD